MPKFEMHGKTHEPANERHERKHRHHGPKRVIVRALHDEPKGKAERHKHKQEGKAGEEKREELVHGFKIADFLRESIRIESD